MNVLPYTLSLGHVSVIILGLLIYVLTNRINHSRRPPGSAVAWVLLLIAFPYIGIPLYLLFGARKMTKNIALHHAEWGSLLTEPDEALAQNLAPLWTQKVLGAMDVPPPVWCPEVAFEADGRIALLSVLELIDGAQSDLCVCTYVLGNDEISCRIMDALVVAADRGVRVRLLVDAIGSLSLSRANVQHLQTHGVQIKRFMPILRNPVRGKTNLRNHRKLIVADGAYVWAGGRNLTTEYFLDSPKQPAWLDMSYRARGDVAKVMLELFNSDWQQASTPRTIGSRRISREGVAHGAIDAFFRMQDTWYHVTTLVKQSLAERAQARAGRRLKPSAPEAIHPPETVALPGLCMQVIPCGPDHLDDTIYSFMLTALYQARESFTIVTPYFVPDDALTLAVCMAARRGVQVRILVPARSNHKLPDLARSRPLRAMAQAGAQVMLVNHMLHAKVYLIDRQVALVGSANLDTRSLFLNYEVLTAFYGAESLSLIHI